MRLAVTGLTIGSVERGSAAVAIVASIRRLAYKFVTLRSVRTPNPIAQPYRLNPMTLHIERLSGPEAIEALTAEWELLEDQMSPRTPFTSPLWAALWWKYLRQTQKIRRHEFFVHVMRDHSNKLVAVFPLVITHQPAWGPLQPRILQFFGASDGSITENRRVVCRREDEAAVIEAFTRHLCKYKSNWDLFLWTGIRASDIDHNQHNALNLYGTVSEYVVPLPESWDSFRTNLSRNTKEKIRKAYKLLSRDGHTFVFRAVEQPLEIPSAIDRFLTLHADRAQLRNRPKHRNYFSTESHRAFIHDFARQISGRGQLRIFELEIGGKVVASRLAFLFGREVYFYYSGFNVSWGKHSVMTTLMCETFKWLIERGVGLANMSTGKDLSKLRWRPHELSFHDAVLASPTLRGRVAYVTFDLLARHFLLWPSRWRRTKAEWKPFGLVT
jgi:CelD/BcsL family acetyltransferase involved in cellulose biosynthesis